MYFWTQHLLERSDAVHAADIATSQMSALYPLRAGDTTNAVSRLENRLSMEVMVLGTMPRNEVVAKALSAVRTYRERNPWSGTDRMDRSVQSILSNVQASETSIR